MTLPPKRNNPPRLLECGPELLGVLDEGAEGVVVGDVDELSSALAAHFIGILRYSLVLLRKKQGACLHIIIPVYRADSLDTKISLSQPNLVI